MIDFKKRIFRRRPDEYQPPILNIRQQHILLSLIEAMNLIDKDDRPFLIKAPLLSGLLHDLADIRNAGRHRVELFKKAVGHRGDHLRERRLARTRRSIKDH